MMKRKKIAPSILSADFTILAQEIKAVEDGGADYIHIDVMDGHFVPNITIGPFIVDAVKKTTALPLDVHLMIENPERYIEDFISAGADIITVHAEASPHLNRTVAIIKELGAKAGVALNPSTSVSALDYVIEDVDMVLVMSVNPGFGGQSFIEGSLRKVEEVRKILDSKGLDHVELEIDGGVKPENIERVSAAGADVFVAGSAIFGKKEYKEIIDEMKRVIS
jgi:ribulose-phosphate 3-epimerase